MTVEAATYIADLQAVNPPSTDPRSQGDDHLRLIKQVLQNTFSGASRQWQIPSNFAFAVNTTLAKTHGESSIYIVTASGPVTITLPSLTSVDIGWKVTLMKTSSDVNPAFIAPPSGTLYSAGQSVSKARRCVPFVPFLAIWDGTNWSVTRSNPLPIGSTIDYFGSSLPAGYEWPNGQTLSSAANYPEYNAVNGGLTTWDLRGRIGVCLDNLGGAAAGRLASGFIVGTTLGAVGGADGTVLGTANLPPYTPSGTNAPSVVTSNNTDFWRGGTMSGVQAVGSYGGFAIFPSQANANGVAAAQVFTGSPQGGTSTKFNNLQPCIMCTKILVVE